MSKLSDLLALSADQIAPFQMGVEVDCESFSPPEGLKEIAFSWAGEGGDIGILLMDAIICYRLAGVEVVLEIPAEAEGIDAEYLLAVAANGNFSLALLPPPVDTPESRAAYEDRLCAFAAAFFRQPNLTRFVYPISSFFEYLVLASVADVSGYTAEDPYIKARWLDVVASDFEASFKARLKSEFEAQLGGEAEFTAFLRGLVAGVFRQVEGAAKECHGRAGVGEGQAGAAPGAPVEPPAAAGGDVAGASSGEA